MSRRRSFRPMIEHCFAPLRKSQRTTIYDLVQGLLYGGKVGLANIARAMRDRTTVRHRIKRVARFVANDRIPLTAVFTSLIHWLLSPHSQAVIALDWTDLGEYKLLKASVVVAHRALPLAWHAMRKGEFSQRTKSRNHAEEQIIEFLRDALAGYDWVLVADRGFARADLFQKLAEWKIRYVIRASGNPWIRTGFYEGKLDSFPRRPGRVRSYKGARYHKKAQVEVNLVVTHEEPAPEPWYLVTNVARAQSVVKLYRKRMGIEESFRDAKSAMGLKQLWLSEPARLARMLILVAIVMAINTLVGLDADRACGGADPQLTTKRKGRTLSMFNRGKLIIEQHGLPAHVHSIKLYEFLEAA